MLKDSSFEENFKNDLQVETDKVLRKAQIVINEARAAIARTEEYFVKQNISVEKINKYLEKNCDAQILRDVRSALDRTINEARREANSKNIELSNEKRIIHQIKKFKKNI